MQHEQASGINFFQRYLTVWVLLCMIVGVAIGHFLPSVPAFLSTLQVDSISIPIAILIWLMIYPMMMKVDFQSVKAVGMVQHIVIRGGINESLFRSISK